ncbi:MAG: hypothetical protein EBV03_05435, partial [Proteobacteria bacterium]|nr:hypothetical protein [Pseudomonadota bacterium]
MLTGQPEAQTPPQSPTTRIVSYHEASPPCRRGTATRPSCIFGFRGNETGSRQGARQKRYGQAGKRPQRLLPRNWLEGGLELRERLEVRDGDLRRNVQTNDSPLLQRSRLYVGVKEILDPLRFTVELQDSRRWFSDFVTDDRDYDQLDILQGYGELHFKDALGKDAPVRLRAGRMSFEVLDRRLIARNEWRNTTNSFQGFRALIGQQKNVWDLDMFALQ